jgi:urea transport system substrate-binding protein
MAAKPVYRDYRAGASEPQGTLLPRRDSAAPNYQPQIPDELALELQTHEGNDTRHDSQRGNQPAGVLPETGSEPVDCPSALGFLDPPLADGELGWLAQFRVIRVLGMGGMGMVLEAEDTHLQRRVALKVIRPELAGDASLRQRFLREARAMAAIHNDHLVTIYQVGQHRDTPFLSMQYLQGQTLQSRLRREPRLPLSEVLGIGIEIAEGLEAAHAHGLIHRDIKPANIFLSLDRDPSSAGETTPPRSTVKILDFGLAVPMGSDGQLTGVGHILGTPLYMAPEQARGECVDHRCDLFSLGAVLYEMAVGVSPFQAKDALGILIAVTTEEPRPLADLDPSLPDTFTQLVHALLSKMPDGRPASARAVAAALREIERNPSGNPSSVPIRALPPRDRNPGPPKAAPAPTPTETVHPGRSAKRARRGLPWLVGGLLVFVASAAGFFFWEGPSKETKLESQDAVPIVDSKQETEPRNEKVPSAVLPAGEPIRVGILHSLTGELAASESSVVDATLLAIDGLNEKGGVLGRPIVPILADGRSDEDTFAREARRLIVDEHVAVVFGCWTSACRKAVKPIFEKHRHLLFYPLYYEGLESSGHIVYTGGAPNQQIIPAVQWSYAFLGKRRFFLAGSDSVYPRTVHAIVKEKVRQLGGEIVGEEYVAPGATDLTALVGKVVKAKPDLIVNSMNGGSNVIFVRGLRKDGITSERVPMLAFNISENVLRDLGTKDLAGDYTVASYYPDLDRPENAEFLRRLRAKLGPQRVATDPMESAYNSVHLWAKAVESARDTSPEVIAKAVRGLALDAPGGPIRVDPDNLHVWVMVRLARIGADGSFDVVWSSDKPVRPEPYPTTRTRTQWEQFLADLQTRWHGRWEADR